MTFLWACFVAALSFSPLFAKPVARVDGHTIEQSELDTYLARHPSLEADTALERLVLFRVAVDAARKQELDELPDVRDAFDHILYNKYLEIELAKSGSALNVDSDREMELYRQTPLLELRELVLHQRTTPETKRLEKKVQAQLKKRRPFAAVAKRYSQSGSRALAGRLDLRGKHNTPEPVYRAALELTDGAIAGPIVHGDQLVWVQRVRPLPETDAPPTYRSWLKQRHRAELENQFLQNRLRELRKKAEVKVYPSTTEVN